MINVSIVSVLAWVGLTLGVVVTVLAYVRFEEMGRIIGVGAGIIIGNVVLLAGIGRTTLGGLVGLGAGVLAFASGFAFMRDFKKRGRHGAGKSS